jgi:N-acetyl-D-muramate 6-phosphate phosphatase
VTGLGVAVWQAQEHTQSRKLRAVLFDLDGTLVDSAPDLAGTVNDQLRARGLAEASYEALRRRCGSGARGMLAEGFGLQPGDAGYASLREEFLQLYATRLLRHSSVFDGVHSLVQQLQERQLVWGVVTNKSVALARPLIDGLGLKPSVLVGGDSTPFTKPHPQPLLEAARLLGLAPAKCAYVGDDPRDMRAGRAAGMWTIAAAWGYLGIDEPLHAWPADATAEHALQIIEVLNSLAVP